MEGTLVISVLLKFLCDQINLIFKHNFLQKYHFEWDQITHYNLEVTHEWESIFNGPMT